MTNPSRPPVPPFDEASARQKVLAAEAAWTLASFVGKLHDQHLADRSAALTALQAVLTPEQRAVADQQLTATHGHRMAARGPAK